MPDLLDSYLFSYLSGSVAEWSKVMVLSTSPSGGVCSNPTATIFWRRFHHRAVLCFLKRVCSKKHTPQMIHTTAAGLVVGTVSKHPTDC